jgi:hypothetical protein
MNYTISAAKAAGPMTEPQFKFLISLIGKAYKDNPAVRSAKLVEAAGFTFGMASTTIDELKVKLGGVAAPATIAPAPAALVMPDYIPPNGSYIIRGIEVEIKKPKYTWAKPSVIVNGKYVGYVGQAKANAAFSALKCEADALEAVIHYAKATHKCGVCHTKLTDPKSIEAGIGPVCAKKYGYKI